jgi:hypothetical protein
MSAELSPEQIAATQWIRAVSDQVDFAINASLVKQQLEALDYEVRMASAVDDLQPAMGQDVGAAIEVEKGELQSTIASTEQLDSTALAYAAVEGIQTTSDYLQQLQDMAMSGEIEQAQPSELVALAEDIVRRMEQLEAEMDRLESAVELAEDELSAASDEDYETLAAELDALINSADPWFQEAVDTAEGLEDVLRVIMNMGEAMVATQ